MTMERPTRIAPAAEDFGAIARRMREIASGDEAREDPQHERQPWCQATDPGRCDYPDCPCGVS